MISTRLIDIILSETCALSLATSVGHGFSSGAAGLVSHAPETLGYYILYDNVVICLGGYSTFQEIVRGG